MTPLLFVFFLFREDVFNGFNERMWKGGQTKSVVGLLDHGCPVTELYSRNKTEGYLFIRRRVQLLMNKYKMRFSRSTVICLEFYYSVFRLFSYAFIITIR